MTVGCNAKVSPAANGEETKRPLKERDGEVLSWFIEESLRWARR